MKNIRIYGEIGSAINAAEVVQAITDAEGEPIEMHINSLGGSVFDGYAIAAAVQRHGQVTAIIDGIAASIAAYIAANAARVIMASGAMYMIHLPEASTEGTAEDHRRAADLLDKITGELVSLFSTRTSREPGELQELLKAETWFTAAEALEMGLIDAIEGRADITPTPDGRALNFGKTYQIAAIAKQAPAAGKQTETATDKTTLDPQNASERKFSPIATASRYDALYDRLTAAAAHDDRIAYALRKADEEMRDAAAAQDAGIGYIPPYWFASESKSGTREQTPPGFTSHPRD